MKAPKKTRVDTSLGAVNIEFADIEDIRDVNDNSKSVKVDENSSSGIGVSPVSDTLREAIEEMRGKVLVMVPDIKRQEEAGERVMDRATVLLSDTQSYRDQLAEVRHEYTSRVNQVSSILYSGSGR